MQQAMHSASRVVPAFRVERSMRVTQKRRIVVGAFGIAAVMLALSVVPTKVEALVEPEAGCNYQPTGKCGFVEFPICIPDADGNVQCTIHRIELTGERSAS
jgi:hypothetical protein